MATRKKTRKKAKRTRKKTTTVKEVFDKAEPATKPVEAPAPSKRQSVYIFTAKKKGLTVRNPLFRPNPKAPNELHQMIRFQIFHFRTKDADLGEAMKAQSEADQRAGAARFVSITQQEHTSNVITDGLSVANVAPVAEEKPPEPIFTAPEDGNEPNPFTTNMDEQVEEDGDFAPAPGTPPTRAAEGD